MKGKFSLTSRARRLVVPLLAALLLALLASSAGAAPSFSAPEWTWESYTLIENPLYPHPAAPEAQAVLNAEEAPAEEDIPPVEVASVEEGGEVLRKAMVARASGAALTFHFDKSVADEDFGEWRTAVLDPWLKTAPSEVANAAMEHTGVPNEGDYLKYQYNHIGIKMSASGSAAGVNVTVTYTLTYYTDAAQEAMIDEMLAPTLETIRSMGGSSKATQLSLVYDFICGGVTYDYDNLNDDEYTLKYTAYAALIDGTAVCQGYANLFYRMALELGIDARIIGGIANGGNHAWNIAKIGRLYYCLDATWDTVTNNDYRWYLKGSENFPDHEPFDTFTTDEFKALYPLSPTDYDGTAGEDPEDPPDTPEPPSDPPTPEDPPEELPTVEFEARCDSDSAYVGDTVTFIIAVQNPVKVKAMMFEDFSYDPAVLEPVSASWLVSSAMADIDKDYKSAALSFSTEKLLEGDVFSITFRVLEDAPAGKYSFSFSAIARGIVSGTEQPLNVAVFDAVFTVNETLAGDMNRDGMIDSDDAIYLLRHTVKASRYPIYQSGDVNGDGLVNSGDAIYLMRHLFRPKLYPLAGH